ncbi:hypothetical protein APTSU1_000750600 [Apodemus speciosus]|uniref:LRAT domain-containing protein n=1 Tax=Apodemus speciosus TaxID=105296 RepID=A0ABQ0EZ85_APOSI
MSFASQAHSSIQVPADTQKAVLLVGMAIPTTDKEEDLRGRGGAGRRKESEGMGISGTLVGASSTFQFFFSEALMGKHFQEVEIENCEPQPGDLFLFKLRSPKAQWCGAHVGVYCGHGEIIHFEGRTSNNNGVQMLLGYCEGVVCKQGHRALQRSRHLWRVLRRRDGIDPRVLESRMREAMDNDPPPYHPTNSNCVHFALNLLGMESMLMDRNLTWD